jgi:hypothetical protein
LVDHQGRLILDPSGESARPVITPGRSAIYSW